MNLAFLGPFWSTGHQTFWTPRRCCWDLSSCCSVPLRTGSGTPPCIERTRQTAPPEGKRYCQVETDFASYHTGLHSEIERVFFHWVVPTRHKSDRVTAHRFAKYCDMSTQNSSKKGHLGMENSLPFASLKECGHPTFYSNVYKHVMTEIT